MAEQVKRSRGRPRGAKDKRPRAVKPPVSAYGASPDQIDEMIEDLAGNGRDEAANEPEPLVELSQHEQDTYHDLRKEQARKPLAAPALPDLFVHRVENGYIVRPAFPQGDRQVSTDARTWVVADKQALAALVLELMAEPLAHPTPIPQPEAFYSPPLIVETATGPMG